MSKRRRTSFVVIGSAVFALAPKCPFCFLAYFGIFGVATTSVSFYRAWLLPLTVTWLVFTVGVLAYQGRGNRSFGPALLGVFAGLTILAGKFIISDQTLVYFGLATLVGAVVWRSWFLRPTSREQCRPCDQARLFPDKENFPDA